MNLVVTLEHRFERTPDGRVWTRTAFPYAYWTRFLGTFETVRAVARVQDSPAPQEGWMRVDGPRVSFRGIPYYVGPWEYARRAGAVRRAVRAAPGPDDAVLLRVSSHLAACLQPSLGRAGRPYALEVVSDPAEMYARGALRHPLGFFFRGLFARRLRRQCAGAAAIAYVTEAALQRRYPAPAGAHAIALSDVDLPDDAFVPGSRPPPSPSGPRRLLMVGALKLLVKAPDVVLRATSTCLGRGMSLRLTIVGDGKHRAELERLARKLGIEEQVLFTGELPSGEPVQAYLDGADLFLMPSRSEGLPRALVEAMARGLVCIGSTVGGIPELLAAEDLVPPSDAQALACKIAEVLSDPERMARTSRRNRQRAEAFRAAALRSRRERFLRVLQETTTDWILRRSRSTTLAARPQSPVLPDEPE